MSQFDHSDLDGHLLELLLAVLEEGSVTRAAERLGVSQSAVSHLLEKLRGIVGDPLFVKSGRGIAPTAHARALAPRARALLDDLRAFSGNAEFVPARLVTTLTIAANDLQRDLLLPPLLRALRREAPGVTLRVIAAGIPTLEMLRDAQCDLVISPRPPEGGDVMQKRLFEDQYRVFYDASQRDAPTTLAQYQESDHVSVLYEHRRRLDIDAGLAERGIQRRMIATVPSFAGVAPFLLGSQALATLPGLLRTHQLRGLGECALPFQYPPMPMYMIWHRRHQTDPVQRWLRRHLVAILPHCLR